MSTTECQRIEQVLLGASSVAEAIAQPEVAAHLPQCPACQALLTKLQKLETGTRTLPAVQTVGPSEAFLERIRTMKVPEPRAEHRVIWIRRSAAAAIIIAVGLMALSVCLMNQRSARADTVLRDLVQWNLDLSAAHDPAARQKIYGEKLAALTKELAGATLSAGEKKIADELLKNAEWLQTENNRLAEAEHFESLVQDVGVQEKAGGAIASQATIETLQSDLMVHGVQDNLQDVHADELTPQQREQFNHLEQQIGPSLPASPALPHTAPAPATGAGASGAAGAMLVPQQSSAAMGSRGNIGPIGSTTPVQVMVGAGVGNAGPGAAMGAAPAHNPLPLGGLPVNAAAGMWAAKNGGAGPVSIPDGGNMHGPTSGTGAISGSTGGAGGNIGGGGMANPVPAGIAGWVGEAGIPDRQDDNRVSLAAGEGFGAANAPVPPKLPPVSLPDGWGIDQRSPRGSSSLFGGGPSMAVSGITGPTSFGNGLFPPPGSQGDHDSDGSNGSGGPSGPATAIATGGQSSSIASATGDSSQLQTVVTTGPGGGLVSKFVATPAAASSAVAVPDSSASASTAGTAATNAHGWTHGGSHTWSGAQNPDGTAGWQGGDWSSDAGADWAGSGDGLAGGTRSPAAWQLYQAQAGSGAAAQSATASAAVMVPEPATGLLAGAGAALLLLRRRRRSR